MDTPVVQIKGLVKWFEKAKVPALDSINATFSAGKIIGLVGPDGAGKTTLIRMMAGLLKPSEGSVSILGYDTIREADEIHALIGYMPQRFGLYEDLSVVENLDLYANLQGLEKQDRDKTYDRLLSFTNLRPFTKRLARDLSGGMKQKLGLACALIRKPKLLLLDEPSVGVDPISRRELWKMTFDIAGEGISVLWSTAYLDEAEKCQEVLLLNEGKLLYDGAPEGLTAPMLHRTFQIQGTTSSRRKLLSKVLQDPRIIDGVVQGSALRIVVRAGVQKPTIQELGVDGTARLEEVKPRFEDAFIDILGGISQRESRLVENFSAIARNGDVLVQAEGLTKQFGNFTAVDRISFSVKRGEIFGLLGPNGAGKSTTFKMLCGLIVPSQGHASVAGLSLGEAPSQARARIGYMAQKFSLYGNMTVLQNLRFFSGIYPVKSSARKNVIDSMIEVFELGDFVNVSSAQLPLGFKQRLSLACALMHNPEVLFLDEPTSGVDPVTRREFWNHINGLVEKGVTVMVTTHFMDEAEYCDRIGLVNEGKMITIGSPDELKESVRSERLPSPTLEDAFILLSERKGVGRGDG